MLYYGIVPSTPSVFQVAMKIHGQHHQLIWAQLLAHQLLQAGQRVGFRKPSCQCEAMNRSQRKALEARPGKMIRIAWMTLSMSYQSFLGIHGKSRSGSIPANGHWPPASPKEGAAKAGRTPSRARTVMTESCWGCLVGTKYHST